MPSGWKARPSCRPCSHKTKTTNSRKSGHCEKRAFQSRERPLICGKELLRKPHAVEDRGKRLVVFFVCGMRGHTNKRKQPFGTQGGNDPIRFLPAYRRIVAEIRR